MVYILRLYRKFPASLRSPRLAPRLLVIRTVLPHFIHQLAGIDVPFLCSHCFDQNLT